MINGRNYHGISFQSLEDIYTNRHLQGAGATQLVNIVINVHVNEMFVKVSHTLNSTTAIL